MDAQGKFVGVLKREEAFARAQEAGVDLVLIVPNAQPPVAKIIDLHKHMYQEEKKEHESKKTSKKSEIKHVRISLFMGKADEERLAAKAKEFLLEDGQVHVSMKLTGPQLRKVPMAIAETNNFVKLIGDVSIVMPPKFEAREVKVVLAKKK